MKIKLLILLAISFYSSIFSTSASSGADSILSNTASPSADPLLCVVLMVKNEQDVIVPTLKPFVDGGVNAFFIFDTGSTDKTVEVVSEFLASRNVQFHVAQEPFVDFATSRNRGLDLAAEKFPNVPFMIMPDAEWYIRHADDLLKFCEEKLDAPEPAYLVRIVSVDLDFYTARLLRTAPKAPRFVGEVHEVLDYCPRAKAPAHILFDLAPSKYGVEKSRARWERDLKLFERMYERNPRDPRTVYYYAQTLWCLNRLEEAYEMYQRRALLIGWDEEDFLTWHRLGRITESLALQNPNYTWAEAMEYYLKAFTMRPCRAEPLICIAQHYLDEDNHQLSFIFATRAAQIPYPENDILMVEKPMYEFQRWEVLSRCAWYLSEWEVGFAAACKAKQKRPELKHVQRNAQLYFDKLCEVVA